MTTVDAGFLIVGECMTLTSALRKSFQSADTGIAAILGSPDPYTEPLAMRLGLHRVAAHASHGTFKEVPASPDKADGEDSAEDAAKDSSDQRSDVGHSHDDPAILDAVSRPEEKLILGLVMLRADATSGDAQKLTSVRIAYPFLEVVKSPLVSGHITSLALGSLEKLFALGILGPDSPEIAACLHELAHALTQCRFAATNKNADDAVLLQLMVLVDRVVSGPTGKQFSGHAVTEIVEACLTMACKMDRGEILRRCVVATLKSVMRTVFSNLARPDVSSKDVDAASRTLDMLVKELDPASTTTSDNTRITVLKVLRACFEVAGPAIGSHPELTTVVSGTLWKFLAQLVRNNTNYVLITEVLSLVSMIMSTCGTQFKLHFEFVLVYVLTALTPLADLPREEAGIFYSGVPNRPACVKAPALEPGSSELGLPTAATQKSPEVREAMVEALARLAASRPSLFADLYVTYDCDVDQIDMCTDLIGFLCRNAYPDSARWSTPSVPPLCLEAVLTGLAAWTAAVGNSNGLDGKFHKDLEKRGRKDVERRIAEVFNKESPKAGIKAAVENKLIPDDKPESIAKFLRNSRRLNKSVVGKFLAKPDNSAILESYIEAFDFSGQRIDEALREFLSTFRLPGESQQIEAIFDKFSHQYVQGKGNTDHVFSSDAAFVLAYAVIMLNTDQHSPSVKRRMDYDAFKRQVAKSNVTLEGKPENFDEEHTKAIYDAIHEHEIVLPDEHDTDESFEHAWKEDVLLPQSTSPFITTSNDPEVIRAVFQSTWRPIVSTLSFVFATATDDVVFSRVISGFHQAATLAAKFGEQGALDHVVDCLSRISTLASGDLSCPYTNIEIRIEGSLSVIVSDLSVPFGSDIKAQMASITLFRILKTAQDVLSANGWKIVAKILTNLYIYGLGCEGIVDSVKPIKPCYTFERSKAGKSVGLFSALSSYLTSSADTPDEPSDDDVDAALGAADCIKACHLPQVVESITAKPRKEFIDGLLAAVPSQAETPAPNPKKDGKKEPTKDKFKPAVNLLLHLASRSAGSDTELNSEVLETARRVPGLRDVQILTAKRSNNSDVLDAVLNDIIAHPGRAGSVPLSALLTLPPTKQVWAVLDMKELKVTPAVHQYVIKNIEHFDVEHTALLSKLLEQDPEVVETLAKLCATRKSESELVKCLGQLALASSSPSARIREHSLAALQRVLLSPDVKGMRWHDIVSQVLIPDVFEQLLKPEVYKRDPRGMDFTRQQAASLGGKVFLQFALNSDLDDADVDAWIKILKALDRLMSSRRQPALQESIEEMLKNVILVLKMSSKGSQLFWTATERELKGFLPAIAKLLREPVEPKVQPKADEAPKTAEVETKGTENDEEPKASEESKESETKEENAEPKETESSDVSEESKEPESKESKGSESKESKETEAKEEPKIEATPEVNGINEVD